MFAGGVRFHTAVSCLFKESSCSCLCHIYSWFLPMWLVLALSILLSFCRVYIYVRLICEATCYFVSTSMFGISHAVENDKKLWNLHIG